MERAQDSAGAPEPGAPVSLDIKVRFSDLDASGHLNNANIVKYIEEARILYYKTVTGMAIPRDLDHWVLAEILVSYRAVGRFDDDIRITIKVPWIKRSSAGWAFTLTRLADGALIAEGSGVHVHVDQATGRGSAIPDRWRQAILDHEGIATGAPAG
ncbi:acyl-CoA thioesterase [Xanthobacter tagetidis]|uniref:Acyl-CoA thioesterase n=1 Tax=Xanthobacter tagetidis TaxID=60216 RepID=A0A3L7AGY0_9HYPH|nr:thioesterase family protein [Xanthobacter tagetidis]MBB6308559.1 acyl-CoA thioester hydrolase [Xanthobacter tagetidis]RLP78672.1 acyl-CoA thioesterase [Xanthobacter tagetidis]